MRPIAVVPRRYFYLPAGAAALLGALCSLHRSLARPLFHLHSSPSPSPRSPGELDLQQSLEAHVRRLPSSEKLAGASISGQFLSAAEMNDDASSSPASYIRLVQHLIEKCICYKLNKEECMETLEKHAQIMPVITSTVWKELEKENREFFETYKKDRGGGGLNLNQEAATTAGHRPPSRVQVQQSCCSSQESTVTTTTLQKNPSGEQEHRVVAKERMKNPSHEQERPVVELKGNRKNPCASKSSGDDDDQKSRSIN